MRKSSWIVCPAVLWVVVACSQAEAPIAPRLATIPALNNGNGVVVQAMGAGVVDFNPAGDLGDGKFQFVAIRRADGTVTVTSTRAGVRAAGLVEFDGVVTCVTIDPNFPGRARIGGVVTVNNSTDPAFLTANHEVGDDVWFRVEDSGDGTGTAPEVHDVRIQANPRRYVGGVLRASVFGGLHNGAGRLESRFDLPARATVRSA